MIPYHEAAKHELACLRWYQQELKELDRAIDAAWYAYAGVKGVRFDKPHLHSSDAVINDIKLSIGEDLEPLLRERERIAMQLKYLYRLLDELDDDTADAVKMVCVFGNTYEGSAEQFALSNTGLWKRINRELDSLRKRMHSPFY